MQPTMIYISDLRTAEIAKSHCQLLADENTFSFQDMSDCSQDSRQISIIDHALEEIELISAQVTFSDSKKVFHNQYADPVESHKTMPDSLYLDTDTWFEGQHDKSTHGDSKSAHNSIQKRTLRDFFLTHSIEVAKICQAMQMFSQDSSQILALGLFDYRVLRLSTNTAFVTALKKFRSHQYINAYQAMWDALEQRLTDIVENGEPQSFHVIAIDSQHQQALSELFQQLPGLIPYRVTLCVHDYANSDQQPIVILSGHDSPLSSNSSHSPRVFSSVASSPRSPFARSDQPQTNGCVMS